MHLVIDIGNSRVKAALFEENELKHHFVFDNMPEFFQSKTIEKFTIDNCILSTVIDDFKTSLEELQKHFSVLLYTVNSFIPLKNLYKTINTLGADRLASAVAGHFLHPNKNVLVIDAGTCIKYNFVNDKNEFIGGAISPGIKMRFKALNTFTARLPLLEMEENFNTLIGTSSKENMQSGVELGAVAEVNGFIEQYLYLYPDLKIVLTGGDSTFFEKHLKNNIFADPFLILKGLNIILTYNLKLRQQQ